MEKRPKRKNPLEDARKCLASGNYVSTAHAEVRQLERVVPLTDVVYAIETGYREKQKDEYKEEYSAWNYSIRGNSTNGEKLRIAISFDEEGLLIITVIKLEQGV